MGVQKTVARKQGSAPKKGLAKGPGPEKPSSRGSHVSKKSAHASAGSGKAAKRNGPRRSPVDSASPRPPNAHAFPLLLTTFAPPAMGALGGVATFTASNTREVDTDESQTEDGQQTSGPPSLPPEERDENGVLVIGPGAIVIERGSDNKKMLPDHIVLRNGKVLDDAGLDAFREKYVRNSRRGFNPERGLDEFAVYDRKSKKWVDQNISLEVFGEKYGLGVIRAFDSSAGNSGARERQVAMAAVKNLNRRVLSQYIVAALGIPLDDESLKGYILDYRNKKDLYDSALTFNVYDGKSGALLDENLMLGRLGKLYGFGEVVLDSAEGDPSASHDLATRGRDAL